MNEGLKEELIEKYGEKVSIIFEPLIYSGVEIEKWEKGNVELKLPVTENMLNRHGILQGGMSYTLADMSAGITAVSLGAGAITVQGSINYIKSVKEGYIFTKNKIIHEGKSTIVINVELFNENKELISNGVFTMFIVDRYDV